MLSWYVIDHSLEYKGWDLVRYNVRWVSCTVTAILLSPVLIPIMATQEWWRGGLKKKGYFIVSKACYHN